MTKDEKIARLRADLLHQKTCYYGGHRCSHPDARAKRDIERLLGEPVTPHRELDEQERDNRYLSVWSGE